MTTDSFVVKPYFFKGGDIGKLSVCGTVNDLAVSGLVPKIHHGIFHNRGRISNSGFAKDCEVNERIC